MSFYLRQLEMHLRILVVFTGGISPDNFFKWLYDSEINFLLFLKIDLKEHFFTFLAFEFFVGIEVV